MGRKSKYSPGIVEVICSPIARQPYALKRLRAAKAGLEMVRGYKVKSENVNKC